MFKKSLIQKILATLARLTVRRYFPLVIGITGSVGKTSTKEAVFVVLGKKYRVRRAEKNYNTEIGLPLTVLGLRHYGKNPVGWLLGFLQSIGQLIFKNRQYPEVLVLEYGVDRPGDMDELLAIARPQIAIVTAIGDIPVHIEFFRDAEELITEKTKLVRSLPTAGYAILNHDDYAVYDMKSKTGAKVLTYGTEKHADLKIMNYELRVAKDEKLGDVPAGISFKVEHGGDVVPIRLSNMFGMPQVYTATAAAAVGLVMKMNFVEIAEALKDYVPPPGRLRLLNGIKDSFILDDTYNASPEAMRAALDTLRAVPGTRKIAVLGDMLEIGRYSEQAHQAVGDQVAEFVDLLFCVGPRAKFIADEALTRGIEKDARRLRPDQIFKFDDSLSAGRALDPLIKAGDVILFKGSQAMRMERAVEEIMAHPEKAEELLVRQDKYWKNH